jgi:hypothetical protein
LLTWHGESLLPGLPTSHSTKVSSPTKKIEGQ